MKQYPFKNLMSLSALSTALMLTGCGGGGSSSGGDPAPAETTNSTQYTFASKFDDTKSSVSYGGQTVRQLIIKDITDSIGALEEDITADVTADLDVLIRGDAVNGNVDSEVRPYATDELFTPIEATYGDVYDTTYGSISGNKNLKGKIAGGDGAGSGEITKLIGDEFFGWEDGADVTPIPIELVDFYVAQLDSLVTDGVDPTIETVAGPVGLTPVVYVDIQGRDYKQLMQKFLLGAVTFSQGTNDYLTTDFASINIQDGSDPFSEAEHKWDEAFGYFGAARNYNDYTDLEIRAKSGRAEYSSGYHDLDGDTKIDLRAEINVANSVNCAKRDIGSTTGLDYTKTAFDAFLSGRQALNDAANGMLTADQLATVEAQAKIAAVTWEVCIAATVVHYINEVRNDDLAAFVDGKFADITAFKDLAKHWSEMKGFALGLQFSPYSPFRDGSVADVDVNDLKEILTLMGDAPVLADGSQNGVAAAGTAADAVADYSNDLLAARNKLQQAYGFDAGDVAAW